MINSEPGLYPTKIWLDWRLVFLCSGHKAEQVFHQHYLKENSFSGVESVICLVEKTVREEFARAQEICLHFRLSTDCQSVSLFYLLTGDIDY